MAVSYHGNSTNSPSSTIRSISRKNRAFFCSSIISSRSWELGLTCRLDVVLHQAGILLQDLLYGGAVRKESLDVLHCKSCALDDGFARHYFGIDGDSFRQVFIVHVDAIDALLI